jgi:hypothetical protein
MDLKLQISGSFARTISFMLLSVLSSKIQSKTLNLNLPLIDDSPHLICCLFRKILSEIRACLYYIININVKLTILIWVQMQASDFFACTLSFPTLSMTACRILCCQSKISWCFQMNGHNHIEYKISFWKFLKTKI